MLGVETATPVAMATTTCRRTTRLGAPVSSNLHFHTHTTKHIFAGWQGFVLVDQTLLRSGEKYGERQPIAEIFPECSVAEIFPI